jgi:hypothetical protein
MAALNIEHHLMCRHGITPPDLELRSKIIERLAPIL